MPICEGCGQEGADKRCSGCMESWYCSIACQRQHWKAGHKHKCVKAEEPSAATAAATAAAVAAEPLPAASGGAAQGGGGGAGAGHVEECAICIDALQQPQTMPCGHRFCRGCVASMRRHGAAVAQVCPLCRGAMPDADRLLSEAHRLLTQHERSKKGQPAGTPLPAAVQTLLSKAAALCREALAIDPADARAHYTLAYVLETKGDLDGAEAQYIKAIELDPRHVSAHYNLGVLLKKKGDLAGAEAASLKAIEIEPRHVSAHYNLGILLQEKGDLAGAEAAYLKAIEINPRHVDAHSNLGGLLGNKGDLAGAEKEFLRVLEIDPAHALAMQDLPVARENMRK
jgi:Flp pilus assembly protein TadD